MAGGIGMTTQSQQADAAQAAEPQGLEQLLQYLVKRLQELAAYGKYWLELHWDKLKLQVISYAVLGLLGLGALFSLTLILASAAVLLVLGSAQLLGEHLFGGSMALGYVTVGAAILTLLPVSLWCGGRAAQRLMAEQLASKYARKRELQRTKYGHDVEQRAATAVATVGTTGA